MAADTQSLLNELNAAWRHERSDSQMTLGGLIEALSVFPRDFQVASLQWPHSYRGNYEDLAFVCPQGGRRSAGELLDECEDVVGQTFTGWKGGEFVMGRDTPIWLSPKGHASGTKLVGLDCNGDVITQQDE